MYMYMWKEPRLAAIKIGYGTNPKARMLDYANTYKLECEQSSLRFVEVPEGFDCSVIEKACHDYALDIGLIDITRKGVLQEVFLLNGEDYESVANGLESIIEDTLHNIVCGYKGGTLRPMKAALRRHVGVKVEEQRPTLTSPYPSLKPGYRWVNPLEGWEQEPDSK